MYDFKGLLSLLVKRNNMFCLIILVINIIICGACAAAVTPERPYVGISVAIVLVALSIMFVTTKIFEKICFLFHFSSKCKPVEKCENCCARVLPLFSDVKQRAMTMNPTMQKDISLYVLESQEVQAYAFGTHYVVITSAALDCLDDEELKAIFAHEFGHIAQRDYEIGHLLFVSNIPLVVYLLFGFLVCKFVMSLIEAEIPHFGKLLGWAMVLLIIPAFAIPLIWFGAVFLLNKANQRTREFGADCLSVRMGYAQALKSAFGKLSDGTSEPWYVRFFSTHPDFPSRIAKIDEMLASASANVKA